MAIHADTKVADLTVAELRAVIREEVHHMMDGFDPDAGLTLSDEVIAVLSQPVDRSKCVSIEEMAAQLGFKW